MDILEFEALTLLEVIDETGIDLTSVCSGDYFEVIKDILNGLGDVMYVTEVPTDDKEIRKRSLMRLGFTMLNYVRGANETYNQRIKLYSDPRLGDATSTTKFNDTPQNKGD